MDRGDEYHTSSQPVPSERTAVRPHTDTVPTPEQYALFSNSDFLPGDFVKIPPGQVLQEDPEIAGYLKSSSIATGGRRIQPVLGFAICAAALTALYLLPGWELLGKFSAPLPAATPQALAYNGDVPLQFRETIDSINADIRAGGRKESALGKLLAFSEVMAEPPLPAPVELQQWVFTEALVLLASRDIPPTYAPELPNRLFAGLLKIDGDNPDESVSFRALSSFIVLTASGRDPTVALNETPAPGSAVTELLPVPDLMTQLNMARDRYGAEMDARPDLLIIEAESHIAAMPEEYEQPDPVLDFHWRRAAYAINLLYQTGGRNDVAARRLDRLRWTRVENYFRFKFSFSYDRLGRIKSARLDGTEYTREMVQQILRTL